MLEIWIFHFSLTLNVHALQCPDVLYHHASLAMHGKQEDFYIYPSSKMSYFSRHQMNDTDRSGDTSNVLITLEENVVKQVHQNIDSNILLEMSERIEPCPICYSVFCVITHAMPNLECKTCHNRFHTTCLFKWFNSSGKNQCVICQQPWD